MSRRDLNSATGLVTFAVFHLNLAFSSIEEEQRADVIARCYWPLLRLAEKHGPIGIEATGFTLEEIALRDSKWIATAKALIQSSRIELIGSGYAQIIGPLVPWRVTEANLRIGNEIYHRLLDVLPKIALVNEQAYSGGLVGLYLDAGYQALLMDWDNPGAQHPHWDPETRYHPQKALGADGRSIGLLWTNTVAFQKLQRFAHGDVPLSAYRDYLRTQMSGSPRLLCAYASDAEIFDFRPGRYKTEEAVSGEEWPRLQEAFGLLSCEPSFSLVSPSQALAAMPPQDEPLRLETAAVPIPVKKQRKYNLSRWAVTGRDDIAVNAACQRIHDAMVAVNADDTAWKSLCYLWASDFRTHITEKRWMKFCGLLQEVETAWCCTHTQFHVTSQGEARSERHIEITTPMVTARLDRRRGLCLDSVLFAGHKHAVIGGLPHGHFDDIALQADWYTGDCVFEAPGEHKITDLEWCQAHVWRDANGDVLAQARLETPKGPIEKTMRFAASEPRIDFDLSFQWPDWGKGSLRLGHITLLPEAFDWKTLSLVTHNGGRTEEHFDLSGSAIDHGTPVSFLVSSSHGLGMTEGWAQITDGKHAVLVSVDRALAPLLGLLVHREAGGSLFCQLQLSALELDDTRKPSALTDGPRRFRFSISAG
jgi:hypothetical protein